MAGVAMGDRFDPVVAAGAGRVDGDGYGLGAAGPEGGHQGCQDQLVTEIVGAEPPGDGDPSSHWVVRPATAVSLRSLAMRSGVARVSGALSRGAAGRLVAPAGV